MPNPKKVEINNTVVNKASKKTRSLFEPLYKSIFFKIDIKEQNTISKIIILLLRFVSFLLYLLYLSVKQIGVFIVGLCNRSIIFKRFFIVFVVLVIFFFIDFLIWYGKIYPGVYVGDIDLGWKTKEEAIQILDFELLDRLNRNNVIIYGNDESKIIGDSYDNASLNEQLSIESVKNSVIFWKTSAVELDASLPVEDIIDKALNSTRGFDKVIFRIGAVFFPYQISPYAQFSDDAVNTQIAQINEALGKQVKNPSCSIIDGTASPTNGENGILLNNEEFISNLNNAFFQKDESEANFVSMLHEKNMDVSFETAQRMASKINQELNKKIIFNYNEHSWEAQRTDIGNCINVGVGQKDVKNSQSCSNSNITQDNMCMYAYCDSNNLSSLLMEHLNIHTDDSCYSINFVNQENGIFVKTQGDFDIPNVADCSNRFNRQYLNNIYVYENNKLNNFDNNLDVTEIKIEISSSPVDSLITLDYALSIGLVQEISKYSTSYTSGAGTENRNKNISIAAQYLNNTICSSNGGTWSFNNVVGDTTADKGYLEAGTIIDDRYSKSVGGGVCQVATTIFNAVYESGLDIVTRHNHDLYISSYPVGRDAAIAYPYMDFVWQNNEKSDVLVTCVATGYSLNVALFGIAPQYTVKTEIGQWVEGDKFKQNFVVDPSKEPNSKFTQTEGSNGKSITIKRLVYNKDSVLIKNEEYISKYNPKNEIIVLGPGDEANRLLEEKNARLKNETDNW